MKVASTFTYFKEYAFGEKKLIFGYRISRLAG